MHCSAGLKEASARLDKQMRLCAIRIAQMNGDTQKALKLLKDLQSVLQDASDEDVTPLVLTADIYYEVSTPWHHKPGLLPAIFYLYIM